MVLAFCESIHATGTSLWHLRWVDGAFKFGGGITSPSLCDLVKQGWDIEVPITAHHLAHNACPFCLRKLAERPAPAP